MYPKTTPPPIGWQSTHDLRQKQLVPVEDDTTLEMRYPTMQPRDILASHFSVHAFVLSGQTPTLAPNLFSIDPKTITSTHEEALEDYIKGIASSSPDNPKGDNQPAQGPQEPQEPQEPTEP